MNIYNFHVMCFSQMIIKKTLQCINLPLRVVNIPQVRLYECFCEDPILKKKKVRTCGWLEVIIISCTPSDRKKFFCLKVTPKIMGRIFTKSIITKTNAMRENLHDGRNTIIHWIVHVKTFQLHTNFQSVHRICTLER